MASARTPADAYAALAARYAPDGAPPADPLTGPCPDWCRVPAHISAAQAHAGAAEGIPTVEGGRVIAWRQQYEGQPETVHLLVVGGSGHNASVDLDAEQAATVADAIAMTGQEIPSALHAQLAVLRTRLDATRTGGAGVDVLPLVEDVLDLLDRVLP